MRSRIARISIVSLVCLSLGVVYASLGIQTSLENNVLTIKKIQVSSTNLPTSQWKVVVDGGGIKLRFPTAAGTGVLKRDPSNGYIVESQLSGSELTSITNVQLGSGSITSGDIASGTLTNISFASGSITCAKLNIPGFSCTGSGLVNASCPAGQYAYGISATGSLLCGSSSGCIGSGCVPTCTSNQHLIYSGAIGGWTCIANGISSSGSSLWEPAGLGGKIRNRNQLTAATPLNTGATVNGNVGVGLTGPIATLHVDDSFRVQHTGAVDYTGVYGATGYRSGWSITTGGVSTTLYYYADMYRINNTDADYPGFVAGLPMCDCAYAGTGTIGNANQDCIHHINNDFPIVSFQSYWTAFTGGTTVKFPFGAIRTFTGPGSRYSSDGASYANFQQNVGDRCKTYVGGPAYTVRRKYAQCEYPYNFGSAPAAPAGGFRYSRRTDVLVQNMGATAADYATYASQCVPGGSPAKITYTNLSTFTTGAYLGKVVCGYNGTDYQQRFLDVPTSGYGAIASCVNITTTAVIGGTTTYGNTYISSGTAFMSGGCFTTGALATTNLSAILYVGSGKVGVLTKTPEYTLDVVGQLRAIQVVTLSDEKLKTNIVLINSPLAALQDIHGYHYTLDLDGSRQYGLLAQEVETSFSSLVTQDSRGVKALDYQGMIAPLIESLRELHSKTEKLQSLTQDNNRRLRKIMYTHSTQAK